MSKSDEQKMAALVRKNAAKVAAAKRMRERQHDRTLSETTEEDIERRNFFEEMRKRDF